MKNLSDLKKEIKLGIKIKKLKGLTSKGIGEVRQVTKVQTNGFAMNGCWLDFPRASLLECEGNIFRVYFPARLDGLNPDWDYAKKGELVGEYEVLKNG